jgi:hypothetical protein
VAQEEHRGTAATIEPLSALRALGGGGSRKVHHNRLELGDYVESWVQAHRGQGRH